jgi:hypothetical protein
MSNESLFMSNESLFMSNERSIHSPARPRRSSGGLSAPSADMRWAKPT